jgi:Tfp pilus assembly protein PilN
MPRDINLLVDGLAQPRRRFGMRNGLWAVVALMALILIAVVGLRLAESNQIDSAAAANQELVALQQRLSAMPPTQGTAERQRAELAALRARNQSQLQVRGAIESGVAGRPQGFAPFMLALSRHARPGLWITRLQVDDDGRGLDLAGRMTDARELPEYLRQLNEEPLFRGRGFGLLSVRGAASAAAPADGPRSAPAFAAFALHAGIVASAASP